jgi:hypothetical protein
MLEKVKMDTTPKASAGVNEGRGHYFEREPEEVTALPSLGGEREGLAERRAQEGKGKGLGFKGFYLETDGGGEMIGEDGSEGRQRTPTQSGFLR